MGTWGSDSFENDDASDWIADFCDAPGKELISIALSRVAEMDPLAFPDAPECRIGIAAAEVVAALEGKGNPYIPSAAKQCVSRSTIKFDSNLVSLALKAVQRIKTDSELKQLWDESENPDEWYSSLDNLEVRLKELDFETLFDVVMDEMKEEEAKGSKLVPDCVDAPVESAASIEELYVAEIVERIHDLIPDPSGAEASDGSDASGAKFDEELYQQLEPLFAALMAHIKKTSK